MVMRPWIGKLLRGAGISAIGGVVAYLTSDQVTAIIASGQSEAAGMQEKLLLLALAWIASNAANSLKLGFENWSKQWEQEQNSKKA